MRVVGPAQFLSLAADRTGRQQIVIAATKLAQFEPERPIVIRTSDTNALPKLLYDLMRLFW